MVKQRPDPLFIGDDLALDFLNSLAAPQGEEIEWIGSGRDFAAWLKKADAVPAAVVARFLAETPVPALDVVARQARELREWFRGFVSNHAGKPLVPASLDALAPLNDLLGQDESYRRIARAQQGEAGSLADGKRGALRWQHRRRWRTPEALLLPIAAAMGDLVCLKDFTLVRKCENPTCTLWFHDISKGHARRWCSMALCGNRAKAAAHRARSRRGLLSA
jgi:predicted RNA-binding Zn ribbon-like protein